MGYPYSIPVLIVILYLSDSRVTTFYNQSIVNIFIWNGLDKISDTAGTSSFNMLWSELIQAGPDATYLVMMYV